MSKYYVLTSDYLYLDEYTMTDKNDFIDLDVIWNELSKALRFNKKRYAKKIMKKLNNYYGWKKVKLRKVIE